MIHLSLDRLLGRIAAQLESARAEDPYERAQLAASAGILRNLVGRVEWRADGERDARSAAILARAQELGLGAGDLPALQARLEQAAGPGADELRERVAELIAWELEREVAWQRR